MTDGVQAAVAADIIDDCFQSLLRYVARQVTKSKPPPSGATYWSDEDVDDLVMAMVDRIGLPTIVLAANKAANDKQFGEWVRRALRTQLHLRARGTPAGFMERVDEALVEDDTFVRTADGWGLVGDDRAGAWDGARARAAEAAWSVPTRTIRHDPDAEKFQLAWRDDMRAVCKAVLEVTGSLPKVVLGEIIAQRFNASYESTFGYLDLNAPREDDDNEPTAIFAPDQAGLDVADEDAARWMLSQFTEEELVELRAVIRGKGTIRGIAAQKDFGKHRAEALRDRISAKLRALGEEAGDDDLKASALLLRMIGQADELLDSNQDDEYAHG